MGLCLSAEENKVENTDEAVLELKLSRDRLKVYRGRLLKMFEEKKEVGQTAEIKKQHLLRILKLVKETDVSLLKVEEMIHSLESAAVLSDVVKSLSEANRVLKEINAGMRPEKIQEILDDLSEIQEDQILVNQAIAYQTTINDSLLEKEYQDLLPILPSVPNLPLEKNTPTTLVII